MAKVKLIGKINRPYSIKVVDADSSVIKKVMWKVKPSKDDLGDLTIELQSSKIYRYFDVPRKVFEGFLKADSMGVYYNEKIKGYPYKKIEKFDE